MPGNPRECRQHAQRALEMAAAVKTESAKQHFLLIAATWVKLATELDQVQSIIEEGDESAIRLPPPAPSHENGVTGTKGR